MQLAHKRKKLGEYGLCLPLKSHTEPLDSKGGTYLAFIIKAAGSNFSESRFILNVVFPNFPVTLEETGIR
jgi:hypothetical protein